MSDHILRSTFESYPSNGANFDLSNLIMTRTSD